MRLSEVMQKADNMRPNSIEEFMKRDWVYRFEAEIAECMGEEMPDWEGYTDPYLLLPEPYANAYYLNLAAYIDHVHEETDVYALDMGLANEALSDAKKYIRRHFRPDSHTRITGVYR